MFKFISVVVLGLCFLGKAEAQTNKEYFLNAIEEAYENGASIGQIDISLRSMNFPYQKTSKTFYFYKVYTDYTQERQHIEWGIKRQNEHSLLNNVKNEICSELILSKNDSERTYYEPYDIYLPYFYEMGICFEQNLTKAAQLYSIFANKENEKPFAAARLGNMFYLGRGVEQDLEKANYYFKKAALWNANTIFWHKNFSAVQGGSYNPHDTLEYKEWGKTPTQLTYNFSNFIAGPWELPAPLIEQVKSIEAIDTDGGLEILNIASHMFHGTGGFEQDFNATAIWVDLAHSYGNADAYYSYANWHIENHSCFNAETQTPTISCYELILDNSWSLDEGASLGSRPALGYMIEFYKNHPDLEWRDWALFQYLVVAQKVNMEIDQELLTEVKNNLTPLEQEIISNFSHSLSYPILYLLPYETPEKIIK